MDLVKGTSPKIIGAGLIVVGAIAAAGLVMQRDQLQAQNAHLQQVVQQEALRELPVIVGFRKPLFGTGKTAEITNVAGVSMAVNAHIVDAASHQPRDFTVNIDPGHLAELGRREGYTFEPGDQLTLAHDGYKSKMWIVP